MKKVIRVFKCDFCETEVTMQQRNFPLGSGCTIEEEIASDVPDMWYILYGRSRRGGLHFCSLDCQCTYFTKVKQREDEDSKQVHLDYQNALRKKENKFFERSEK